MSITKKKWRKRCLLAAVCCLGVSLGSPSGSVDLSSGVLAVTEFTSPAAAGSSSPFLSASPEGKDVLSWLEPAGSNVRALRFASLAGHSWSAPRTVSTSAFFNPHPAVLPSVRFLPNGSLVSYWTHRGELGPESEEVYSARSSDGGIHWSRPVTLHRDSSRTEHSLVSMANAGSEVSIVWLDDRDGSHSGKTALMQRSWKADGSLGPETLLDDDVCGCCPTASANTAQGVLVAYRKHTADNIRDIYYLRHLSSGWSKPHVLHADNWHINGCPTNAADVAADGKDNAAIAWFTAADGEPHVKIAFSTDSGGSFSEPLIVDQGRPVGHVSVALLMDGSALVSWIDRSPPSAQLLVRRIDPKAHERGPVTVVAVGSARDLGYPRIVSVGAGAILAWTERDVVSNVHTAVVSIQQPSMAGYEKRKE